MRFIGQVDAGPPFPPEAAMTEACVVAEVTTVALVLGVDEACANFPGVLRQNSQDEMEISEIVS